ncbi:MAG: hypothetical protein LBS30_03815, partial [Planctomycetota bacterium]|nr:hypothetical protein [Planctomycetota bacterium]
QAAAKTDEAGPAAPKQNKEELSGEREEFARAIAVEISRPFVNVKSNPLMMQLRASVIRKLVLHGKNGAVNIMRRPSAPPPAGQPEDA